jgi:hypothetical protein
LLDAQHLDRDLLADIEAGDADAQDGVARRRRGGRVAEHVGRVRQ